MKWAVGVPTMGSASVCNVGHPGDESDIFRDLPDALVGGGRPVATAEPTVEGPACGPTGEPLVEPAPKPAVDPAKVRDCHTDGGIAVGRSDRHGNGVRVIKQGDDRQDPGGCGILG